MQLTTRPFRNLYIVGGITLLVGIVMQKQAIEKWNGQFPTVIAGNGAVPFININPATSTASQ